MTEPEPTELPYNTVPFSHECLDMLAKIRQHYWDRSNQALDQGDPDEFMLWNRKAKQVTSVIATAQDTRNRDRDAWATEQTARLQAAQARLQAARDGRDSE
jgi:hypothetical protein